MIRDIYTGGFKPLLRWSQGKGCLIIIRSTLADHRSLPGTPIWLAAVYTDKFGPVNKYWLPGMW